MVRAVQQQHLSMGHASGDALGKLGAAVFVVRAVDGQHRAAHLGQHRIQRPIGKVGVQPGIGPGMEQPIGALAMPFFQAGPGLRIGKKHLRGANAFQRAGLHIGLCRQRQHGLALLGMGGRNVQRHHPAHAVPQQRIACDAQGLHQGGKVLLRLVLNEAQVGGAVAGAGSTKAQAVVGQYGAACGLCQLGREIAPQPHAAQRLVQ